MCAGGYGSSGSEDEEPLTPVAPPVVKQEAGVKLEGPGLEGVPKVEVKEEKREGSEEVDYGESSGSASD